MATDAPIANESEAASNRQTKTLSVPEIIRGIGVFGMKHPAAAENRPGQGIEIGWHGDIEVQLQRITNSQCILRQVEMPNKHPIAVDELALIRLAAAGNRYESLYENMKCSLLEEFDRVMELFEKLAKSN